MSLQMLEPSKGTLTVWALKTLLFFARLGLGHLRFARGGFHGECMGISTVHTGSVAIGSVDGTEILEYPQGTVWHLETVGECMTRSDMECSSVGKRDGARRSTS